MFVDGAEDAGDPLVDLLTALICLLAGGSLGLNLGVLDLSIHVAKYPNVGTERARLADDTA